MRGSDDEIWYVEPAQPQTITVYEEEPDDEPDAVLYNAEGEIIRKYTRGPCKIPMGFAMTPVKGRRKRGNNK